MAWSFICPTEINAFSMRASEFATRDASVLFISTDSEHVLRAWNSFPTDEGGLGGVSVPLLSDRNCRIAKDYGVLIEEEGISQRAVFIIDPTGIIRSSSVNDANLGRSVDEVARLLDALKFSGKPLLILARFDTLLTLISRRIRPRLPRRLESRPKRHQHATVHRPRANGHAHARSRMDLSQGHTTADATSHVVAAPRHGLARHELGRSRDLDEGDETSERTGQRKL